MYSPLIRLTLRIMMSHGGDSEVGEMEIDGEQNLISTSD